ncbi:hypothetical protein [Rickettsia bellii]|uniref:Uncharacterized protein n=1 Tax=Rickettsia bellii str. RML An4 TaxID=1359193 RepID=A0A0F3QC94_RICBE|nr:hypothetical protein [Rickettsia bellii]KJV90200.1 hypothetical protein RBEAN4_1202 [Rickettsia bellii str. RML An4]
MYTREEKQDYEQKPNIILEFLEKNVKFTLEEILKKNAANKVITKWLSNMSIEKQKQLTDLINSEFRAELSCLIDDELEKNLPREENEGETKEREITEADVANIYKKIVDDSNGYLTIIDDILIIDRQHNNFVLGVYAEDKVEQFLLKNYDCRSTETAVFTWLENLDSEKKEQIINNSNEKIIKVLKQKIVPNIFKEKYDVSLSEEDIAAEYKKISDKEINQIIRDCCKLPITHILPIVVMNGLDQKS